LGFILSVAAIIFIYYSEGISFDLKFLGNIFATTSAVGSAVLHVIWKNSVRNRASNKSTMLLTLIGLCTLLLGWPMIVFLQILDVESISVLKYIQNQQIITIVIHLLGSSLCGFGNFILFQIKWQFKILNN
jgi:hypothetical protein